MTLSEMANYICSKVGQTDAESVAACNSFLARRYQLVWDFGLWAESQGIVSVTGTTGDPSLLQFPESVDRVINIRNTSTSTTILGSSYGTIFDYDPALFNESGVEAKFVHLPRRPVSVVANPGRIIFDTVNTEGQGDVVNLTVVGATSTGALTKESIAVSLNAAKQSTTIDFTGKTGASMDNSGTGRGFKVPLEDGTILGVYFSLDGLSVSPLIPGVNAGYIQLVVNSGDNGDVLASNAGGALSPYFTVYPVLTGSSKVTVQALEVGPESPIVDFDTGAVFSVTTGRLGSSYETVSSFSELYYITTAAGYTLDNVSVTTEDGVEIGVFTGSLFPDSASKLLIERIRVYAAPSTPQTYFAHVKTRCTPLGDDDDSPSLSGVENALLAFGQADMLERQRQYAKSASKMSEAGGMLQAMLDLEKNQQAYDSRIVPVDGGWGNGYDDWGTSKTFYGG